jgi:hypothetical protein
MSNTKGELNGECNRTECKGKAVAYNQSTQKYYCIYCATKLNRIHKEDAMRLFGSDLCILPVDTPKNLV